VARYDRVIPPGGRGKVTFSIDTGTVRGEFEKKAAIWSDDPENGVLTLILKGQVKPHILIEPGGYVSLWGVKGRVPQESLTIINNHKEPLKITGIDHDLEGKIRWRLEEIIPGYRYRLKVEDISGRAGEYAGHLIVRTDNPRKPRLVIIVNGTVNPY